MPKMSDVVILQQNEQPTLVIRTRTRVEALPKLIGESYAKIASYLGELGELMTDVPFVAYHNMDMQDLDVEIGFCVSQKLSGKDDIRSGVIPAGQIVFCMYRGPYAEIGPVYDEMAKWIEENGRKAAGAAYEYYYNGPDFPQSELLTKIVMPLQH